MNKIIFFLFSISFIGSLKAQIFTQNFESSISLSDYVSNTPTSLQFSDIHTEPNAVASITNNALRIEKTAFTKTYFFRTPNPNLTEIPTFLQFKFDFEVTNNSQDHPDNRREIPFYFGPTFADSGTTSATYHSRFGLGISATTGNFFLKILDNGSAKSTEFSGKQTITFIINNTGSAQTYTAPNTTSESIANDTWEIWVGDTKVFNDVASRNINLNLGSFKFQYNSFLPNAILDFDNFEMKALAEESPTTGTQSLMHPRIWVKNTDKQVILDKIAQHSWAQRLFEQYISRLSSLKSSHGSSPQTIINTIPALPGSRTTHRTILTTAYEAAFLYWLTDDNDYGQIAADILNYYTTEIAQISGNVNFHNGDYLVDSREAYTKPPMIYDFVYGFLKKSGTTVYDKDSGSQVPFDFVKAQTTFKKLADNVYSRGGINSNHPILEAPAALFNTIAIDDDVTREAYFNKFMNGTNRQNGLTWMMNECKESGIWPESTGYSIGPQRIILELMEVVDKFKPSLNVIDNNLDILESSFFYENFRFPNGNEVMRFGDAHRTRLNTQAIMERVIVISTRKGYANLKEKSKEILKAIYNGKGGYNPSVSTQTLEWNNPLPLLYGINVDLTNVTPITYNRSANIKHAGIAMQRNINTSNVVESGLMGYTGGAHYVHSHLSGIDMEIYGLGAVLGTGGGDVGAGNNARDGAEFRNYHRIYAGHNTVIVNGKSKGRGSGSWKSDNQLYMDKTQTVAAEPKSIEDAIANEFSFSAQVLNDNVNNAKQQRVFSIIRTSDNAGYYFDLFRSKSLEANDYHDYVYHNVGDEITMVDENDNPLALTNKTDRYTSIESVFNGKSIFFPGWHYFEDVNTSTATTSQIKATIPMTKQGTRYMHILMPGGEAREYTACKGPETIEAQMGYEGQKTPVLTVRHIGEAWDKPFVSIFEPSRNIDGTVKSVENIYNESKIVGAKVISSVNGNMITDLIISNEDNQNVLTLSDYDIEFTGRFAIVRFEVVNDKTNVSLYIGEGQQLTFNGQTIDGDNEDKAYLQYTLDYIYSFTPKSNIFNVETVGETCVDMNNGSININSDVSGSYVASINAKIYEFTNSVSIEDLEPGIYNLCISITGINYKQCYELVIEEASSLAGKIQVTKKSANVIVTSGTAPFKVYKNGEELFETYLSSFSVNVNHGDKLEVKSKAACQGVITNKINLLESIEAYPNPSKGMFKMNIPSDIESVSLEVYNIQSQLVRSGTFRVHSGSVLLNLEDIPDGIYFVKIDIENQVFLKLIKR